MEVEKKRMVFFGTLLSLAIIGSVVLFFWGNLINRGTIRITGEPPFDVQIVGFSQQNCTTSPCSIKTKSGYKDLIINKKGYQSIITSSTVKLWGSVNLPLTFEIIPQVAETDFIPDSDQVIDYELVLDPNVKMQKLISKSKIGNEALAFFPKFIANALIIGGKNSALVIDRNLSESKSYFVDLNNKTRSEIDLIELSDIEDGRWSNDGKYLVFTRKGATGLWLLNTVTKIAFELSLMTNLKQTSWAYNNELLFVTDQAYASMSKSEIKLLREKVSNNLTFGIYHPGNNKYTSFGDFPEIQKMPEEFIVTAGGDTVYFKSEDKNFRIILRKF